jgi:hypothetical protein
MRPRRRYGPFAGDIPMNRWVRRVPVGFLRGCTVIGRRDDTAGPGWEGVELLRREVTGSFWMRWERITELFNSVSGSSGA